MAAAVSPRLRVRLLLAFVLVSVPPVLLLAVLVSGLVVRRFEQEAAARLLATLEATRAHAARVQQRVEAEVAAAATLDVPAGESVDAIAARRGLDAVEIVDAGGRVLASHHWPAGLGLPDRDRLFPGESDLRVEKVAAAFGAVERLVLSASRPTTHEGGPATLRAGAFLGGEPLLEIRAVAGAEVGLYDAVRRRWIVAEGSPLLAWQDPPLASASSGDAVIGGVAFRWASRPLAPMLFMAASVPRAEGERVRAEVLRYTLWTAAGALLLAVAAGAWLSRRIARPVAALAAAARRIGEGELETRVEPEGSDELAELARAFDVMTAELRASRERLVQAERVAAWRELARRLAHELKNPLFPIQVSVETLRRALERDPREAASLLRESSDTILEELRSLRRIVDEFAEFARLPRPRLADTDLNAVVEQALALHRPRAGAVRLETALDPELGPVQADRDLLARALGNLVANAIEAMPQGGTLRVRTRAADSGVAVEVSDTGPGLDQAQRARLFTPYVTTKPAGTGLGLAIVQGIVSDHGGRIEVASEPGRGTTFTLRLPRVPPAAQSISKAT